MRTKKEICSNNKTFAVYAGAGGVELKFIEHGIEDYIYFVAGTMTEAPSYHRAKVYDGNGGPYFKLYGQKIPLDECLKVN